VPCDIKSQILHPARSKTRLLVLTSLFGIYMAVYAGLSARGSYVGHNEGGNDNRDTWFPAYCAETYTSPAGREKIRLTLVGWLFLPAMLIDQIAIHRTHSDAE
jgi:hypothetical protein